MYWRIAIALTLATIPWSQSLYGDSPYGFVGFPKSPTITELPGQTPKSPEPILPRVMPDDSKLLQPSDNPNRVILPSIDRFGNDVTPAKPAFINENIYETSCERPTVWHPSPPPANFSKSTCNVPGQKYADGYHPDVSNVQVLLGFYHKNSTGPTIPPFDYVLLSIRRGWMLTAPQEFNPFWRGTWEYLCEFSGAGIHRGSGTGFVGFTNFLRYNFLHLDSFIVPYAQAGVGAILSDIYKDRTQRGIGQAFSFYLHLNVGTRILLTDNLSFDIEGGFHHISNANTADRNFGVNALGVQFGFTYFLP